MNEDKSLKMKEEATGKMSCKTVFHRDDRGQRILFAPLLLLLVFLAIFANDAVGDPSTKIVKSRSPLFGNIVLDGKKTETLIRESDSDERFIFKRIADLALDSKGRIYLLDEERILKYSPDGTFLTTIGRKGQGPGEFISPCKLFVDEKDNLFVSDEGRSLSVFDSGGRFVELIRLNFTIHSFPENLRRFVVDNKGNIIAIKFKHSEEGIRHICIKANRKGVIVNKIMNCEQKGIAVFASPKGTGAVLGMFTHPYSPGIHFCFLKEGMVCLGANTAYALHIVDMEGKEKLVFGKEEKAERVSRAEINSLELGEGDLIPSHRPFFKDILSDEKGRIYVLRVAPLLVKESMQGIDIFSRDGRYLYNMKTPLCPQIVKNGCFYAFRRNADERTVVEKMRISNYEQMKF